jgi:digeranylgeranylglycerophospholipid reductase
MYFEANCSEECCLMDYDIVVVGGGPAGLSAAYSASKMQARTIVLEKDDAIGQFVRTSGVTWIDDMKRLKIPEKYYNPIKNYRIISQSNEVLISGQVAKSCVLDVRATYQYLASLAAEAGSDIMVRSQVRDVTKDSSKISGVKAITPKGEIQFNSKLVIDASGFSSTVARKAGLVNEWKRYGIGAEYECFCECVDPQTWILMVGSKYSSAGYAWVFPISRNRVRIGVGIGRPESRSDPLKNLNELLEKRIKPLDELGKIQPLELHYGLIPNEGCNRSSVHNGLMLVGDCAGQSNPLVLEGIRFAIQFGRLAGVVGANSLSSGSTGESLKQYDTEWRNQLESRIKSAIKVQSRWLTLSDEQWDKEIEILSSLSQDEFLDFIKAEFTASTMLRLSLHHPHLVARRLFDMVLRK